VKGLGSKEGSALRLGDWLGRALLKWAPKFMERLGRILYEEEISRLRERAVTFLLECLRYELIALNGDLTLADLRTNLMLLRPNGTLQMTYISGDYSLAEKQLEWREGIGCCGMAWARKEPTVTDAQDTERLPPTYREIVKHVKSVISVPVKRVTGDWVGVLNADSTKPLSQSRLDEAELRDVVIRYAVGIGLLF